MVKEEVMVTITLPDGKQKQFEGAVTVAEVAQSIGAGLAKAALAGKVNGKLVDTSYKIEQDAEISVITGRDQDGLEVIRHSTAHLLAQAVKRLFPQAQVTIGPVIENGFYYDFSYPAGFSLDDFPKIENEMQKIVAEDQPVKRHVMSRNEAIKFFREHKEEYKARIIEDIPENETLTVYQQGEFYDLCRGPHVPRTGLLGVFKLMKLAGAYWRGDAKNEMLQRIYGTAWADKKSLQEYLHNLEEAEKRDHRKIAKKMDLFHLQEEAPGMIFWHAKGWQIYQTVEQYLRNKLGEWDYQEIRTPQILDRSLWEKSGHWDKYQDMMFTTESEERLFAVKPMSCPCHIQVFKQGLRSYRELPLRLAEFGNCHRNEPSGTLHGLMRVRNFVQDDGHIFCTEEQIRQEIVEFNKQLFDTYKAFGFEEIIIKLSTRPDKRVGSDEIWDKAEHALQQALESTGVAWDLQPGEGAFYGPKIEYSLKDCLGRVWQCGTMQVDFLMPERLGAYYIAEDGSKRVPVMLHRAMMGSMERFIGVLIEHYAGNLPFWLAPQQVVVMNITDQQAQYVQNVTNMLKKHGIRAQVDLRNEKISFKIREHSIEHVPYMVIIGDREMQAESVAIRTQDGRDLGIVKLSDLASFFKKEAGQSEIE